MVSTTGWAAGLFEGEGTIYLHPKRRSVILKLWSTDLDVLERFSTLVGGTIYPTKQRENRKPCWEWNLGKKADVVAVLERFLPFLGHRRACKALDAFDHYDL